MKAIHVSPNNFNKFDISKVKNGCLGIYFNTYNTDEELLAAKTFLPRRSDIRYLYYVEIDTSDLIKSRDKMSINQWKNLCINAGIKDNEIINSIYNKIKYNLGANSFDGLLGHIHGYLINKNKSSKDIFNIFVKSSINGIVVNEPEDGFSGEIQVFNPNIINILNVTDISKDTFSISNLTLKRYLIKLLRYDQLKSNSYNIIKHRVDDPFVMSLIGNEKFNSLKGIERENYLNKLMADIRYLGDETLKHISYVARNLRYEEKLEDNMNRKELFSELRKVCAESKNPNSRLLFNKLVKSFSLKPEFSIQVDDIELDSNLYNLYTEFSNFLSLPNIYSSNNGSVNYMEFDNKNSMNSCWMRLSNLDKSKLKNGTVEVVSESKNSITISLQDSKGNYANVVYTYNPVYPSYITFSCPMCDATPGGGGASLGMSGIMEQGAVVEDKLDDQLDKRLEEHSTFALTAGEIIEELIFSNQGGLGSIIKNVAKNLSVSQKIAKTLVKSIIEEKPLDSDWGNFGDIDGENGLSNISEDEKKNLLSALDKTKVRETFAENKIKSLADFKDWLHNFMENVHGSNYNKQVTEKVADDLNKKYEGNFGSMIGAAKSFLHNK